MTNFEQFLFLSIQNNIIEYSTMKNLLNLFADKYPNSELAKDIFIEIINRNSSDNILDQVLSFSEAQKLYNLSPSTLSKNVEYGRYLNGEIKKSGNTWLITTKAMERLYGHKTSSYININKFLNLATDINIITANEQIKLQELLKKEFPNMDIYQNVNTINLSDLLSNDVDNDVDNIDFSIDDVFTFSEATEKYNLYKTTLRKNVDYDRYLPGEVRQSKGTWLITKMALERLYGNKVR